MRCLSDSLLHLKSFVLLGTFLGAFLFLWLFYPRNVVWAGCDGNQQCGVGTLVCVPTGCIEGQPGCTCTTECQSDGTTVGCTGDTEAACFLDRCASQSKCQVSSGCVWTEPTPAPVCTDGQTENRTCASAGLGDCGSQTRICSNYTWGDWTGTCTGFPQWNECRGASESWACRTTTATSCTQTCSGTGCGCADGSYCQPPAPVCNSLTVQGTMANGGGTSNAYTAVSNVNFITNKTGDVTDQRFWRSMVSEPSGWIWEISNFLVTKFTAG